MRQSRYPQLVTPWKVWQKIERPMLAQAAPSSLAWNAANLAEYLPLVLPQRALVASINCHCTGGTAAGRNFDIGIYGPDGVRLASQGSVLAVAGINSWACNRWLEGGVQYWIGMSCDNNALLFMSATLTATQGREGNLTVQSTAFPLPNPMVPAQWTGSRAPDLFLVLAGLP